MGLITSLENYKILPTPSSSSQPLQRYYFRCSAEGLYDLLFYTFISITEGIPSYFFEIFMKPQRTASL
jgi:hypothetical protein